MIITDELVERFNEKIEVSDNSCWTWRGARHSPRGYGSFGLSKQDNWRVVKAHKFSYFLHKGSIPSGACVMHTCDNTMCVNPNHLMLGTHQDNMRDRNSKGRQARLKGESNGNSKLTTKNVLNIRKLYSLGEYSFKDLAKKFKVSKKLILNIVHRKAWKHV